MRMSEELEYDVIVDLEDGMFLNLKVPKRLNVTSLEALLKRLSRISKATGVSDVQGIMARKPYHKRDKSGFNGFESEEDVRKVIKRIENGETAKSIADERGAKYPTFHTQLKKAKEQLNNQRGAN